MAIIKLLLLFLTFSISATVFAESSIPVDCKNATNPQLCNDIQVVKNSKRNKLETAQDVDLKLTLRGIIAEDNKHLGIAIVQQDNDDEDHVFVVGDSVYGVATLEEVNADHVVLFYKQKHVLLYLADNVLSSKHYLDSDEVKEARKRIATNYRKRLLSRDGMDLINLFGFRPFHQGGFVGFQVTALGDEGREMMTALGVEEGDLITVVNGMRLSENLEHIDKLKELKTATSVDVIIDRNGEEIPFHFEFGATEPTTAATAESKSQSVNNAPLSNSATNENMTTDTQNPVIAETVTNNTNSTQSSIDEDNDLGQDWGESVEDQQYMDEQRATIKTPNKKHELEYDH